MEEYSEMDKGTRILAYKMLIEKFNEKYGDLTPDQKLVLKEFINNVSSTTKLKDFVNNNIDGIKKQLTKLVEKVEDNTIKIKINEVVNLIKPLDKNQSVKDDDIITLLTYHQLVALKMCLDRTLPVSLFEKDKSQRSAVTINITGIGAEPTIIDEQPQDVEAKYG